MLLILVLSIQKKRKMYALFVCVQQLISESVNVKKKR